MLSLKDTLRKLIVTATLAAVTTHFFTGCSNNKVTSSDLYAPELTYEVTSEAPPLTYEALNPGITESDSDSFSIKYKYWYDNPEVKESQEQSLAESNPTPGSLTDRDFLNLPNLPIYRDSGGNEYIISGRTKVYLVDGRIAPKDIFNLRSENEGYKFYRYFPAGAVESIADVAEKITSQPSTYDERVSNAQETPSISGIYAVYVNNTDSGATFNSDETKLDITSILSTYGLAVTTIADNSAVIKLRTGAGDVTLTLAFSDDKCELSYSTDVDDQTVDKKEISLGSEGVLMTLDAIEDYLGYDVEYYDDFINIVTDNKDIITVDSILPQESYTIEDKTLENNDTTKPASDPDNVAAREELIKENTPEQPEASKPETTKTPDGKYDLADTDLVNPDGTYTQQLGTGDPTDVSVPSVCPSHNAAWTTEKAASRHGQSNPSMIPYSQITLENAAEAFPYLGYIGYSPNYLEIFPTDTEAEITKKIWNNLVGTECTTYYHYYLANPSDADKQNYPTHFFSSESEYNTWLAELRESERKADEADAKAREDRETGNFGFDDNGSQEDIDAFNDLLKDLGF